MRNFRSLLRHLRNCVELGYPIQVRRVRMPVGIDGDCSFRGGRFVIRIDRTLPEYYSIEVLLHEYAHGLSWNLEEEVHGESWGKAYSEIYLTFLRWLDK